MGIKGIKRTNRRRDSSNNNGNGNGNGSKILISYLENITGDIRDIKSEQQCHMVESGKNAESISNLEKDVAELAIKVNGMLSKEDLASKFNSMWKWIKALAITLGVLILALLIGGSPSWEFLKKQFIK